jgi:hypothetical protein
MDGADPVADRRRQRRDFNSSAMPTLDELLAHYGQQVGKRQKRWAQAHRGIAAVFKVYLPQPLSTLTARDLQIAADRYSAKLSASAAVRYLRTILKWAAQRGYIDQDCTRVVPPFRATLAFYTAQERNAPKPAGVARRVERLLRRRALPGRVVVGSPLERLGVL